MGNAGLAMRASIGTGRARPSGGGNAEGRLPGAGSEKNESQDGAVRVGTSAGRRERRSAHTPGGGGGGLVSAAYPPSNAGAARWAGACLVASAAHLAIAIWLLNSPVFRPADTSPPAAIMIDLAAMPEAILTEANEIAPDREAAEASTPAESAQSAPAPEETVEPDSQKATPPTDAVAPQFDTAVPLPAVKPEPPEKKPQDEDKQPPEEQPAEAERQPNASSRFAMQAQALVTESDRNAASQTASGAFSSSDVADWQSRLMAYLERHKRYPPGARSRREQGTAHVRFDIDEHGNVLSVSLAHSSGYPEIDDEVLALVRRASPLPAPPPGARRSITAPVRFSVK